MAPALKLMAVLAHPDDESLGLGGTLAKYAGRRRRTLRRHGDARRRGRYRGHPPGDPAHPGREALAAIRERELRAAAAALGVRDVSLLDYQDQQLDAPIRARRSTHRRDISGASARRRADVRARRRVRPSRSHRDLAVHDGGDRRRGRSACARAATPAARRTRVSKLYYMAWPATAWAAYQAAFKKLVSTVDGVERQATPWPDWAITTVIDTRDVWPTVWRAVSCHESQVTAYERLQRPVARAPRGALGLAVVLPRVQHGERRPRARDRSVRRDSMR